MAQNIDQLQIEIKASADHAKKSIRELKNEVTGLKKAFSGVSSEGGKTADSLEKMASDLVGTKLGGLSGSGALLSLTKLGGQFFGIRELARGLTKCVTEATALTETMNLFSVALKDNAQEGIEFVTMLQDSIGINGAIASDYMAQFYQISNALGLVDEKALKLSKDFTKLTYDLSSLFNIDFNSAFEKLRAGLVGETEPLRQLGITITEANLAETARRLGIEKTIRSMTEAEKIELRYVTVMQMAVNAMNDYEMTQDTLANGIRNFNQQWQLLMQNIGALFVPMLTKIMPYLIGMVQLIGQAIGWLANLFGITIAPLQVMENVTSSTAQNIGAMSEGLDKATNSAKKLKNYMLGIDELNVLDPNTGLSSGGSGGINGGLGGGLGIDFEQFGYEEYVKKVSDAVENAKRKLEQYVPFVQATKYTGTLIDGFTEAIKTGDWSHFWDAVEEVNQDYTKNRLLELMDYAEWWNKSVVPFWNESVVPFLIGWFDPLGLGWDEFRENWTWTEWWNGLRKEWDDSLLAQMFTLDFWTNLGNNIMTGLQKGWDKLKEWWKQSWFSDFWEKKVTPIFTKDYWKQRGDNLESQLREGWEKLKTWWKETWFAQFWEKDVKKLFTVEYWKGIGQGLINGFKETWKDAINEAVGLLNRFIGWVNEKLNLSLPAVEIAGHTIFEGLNMQLLRIPNIPYLARGGMLEAGMPFVAGEAGAELIGNYNGKTTVMPLENTSFVETMGNAVFKAVVNALNDSDGFVNVENIVELDGETLYRSHQRVANRKGKAILGGVW